MLPNLIDTAPENLDTLNELANALADDANYAAVVQAQLATKASIPYVDGSLATKHPLLPDSSDLAIGRLITSTWIPPPGIQNLNLDLNSVYFWTFNMAISYIDKSHILVSSVYR